LASGLVIRRVVGTEVPVRYTFQRRCARRVTRVFPRRSDPSVSASRWRSPATWVQRDMHPQVDARLLLSTFRPVTSVTGARVRLRSGHSSV